MTPGKRFGKYTVKLQVAYDLAAPLMWLIAAGWLLFPTALLTVIHPSDAIGLQYKLSGERVPHSFTPGQLFTGEVIALMVLAALSALLFGMMVAFYRKVGAEVALWPVALMLVGVLGNIVWWIGSGYFDLLGFLAGLTSMVITVGCEAFFVERGLDVAFGSDVQEW